uniref:Uridylate-specific endoribonuclease n=1 Tax=Lates calcarifer TaxID=8187 RepID=A0A4W6E8Y5_LATCA
MCRFCGVLVLLAVSLNRLNASRPAVNQELSSLFNELWRLDVNRMSPAIDYTISVQGRASFVSQGSHVVPDHASQPLFSNVNENKLKNTTTTSLFMKLLDNYERSTGVTERVTTEEQTETNLFLDAVLQTEVMKRAHRYLVSKGQSSSDLRLFKNQLNLNLVSPLPQTEKHRPGLLWIRARLCWRNKIWNRNHWFSQLDPVLPARKKQALALQRIQSQGA